MNRICRKCNRGVPDVSFGRRAAERDGIDKVCRSCRAASQRECYRRSDSEKKRKREQMRLDRRDPVKRSRANARRRARYATSGRVKQAEYFTRLKALHFFVWRARLWSARHGVKVTAGELAGLWRRQRGLCALSGIKLSRNAELDHIKPASKGGEHNATNLRWLDPRVNYARRDMPDEDFISLCSQVAAHAPAMSMLIERQMQAMTGERAA